MNILVCIKQVPDTGEIRIDPETNTLIREGVTSIVNTYDMYALEAAARIRDEYPDTHITVLTMGPESAERALRDCLAAAADEAWLVSGREFAGSDTMATAYTLSIAIRTIEERKGIRFDAVFCGKQAIDGDTAQVGPMLAEYLALPQITCAASAKVEHGELIAEREALGSNELLAARMPCLITFTKPQYAPRLPTLSRRMAARKAKIYRLRAGDLKGIGLERTGLKGSPTKVVRTEVPDTGRNGIIIDGNDPAAAAYQLAGLLNKENLI